MKVIFVTYCRVMLGANKSMLYLIKDLRARYGVEPLVIVPEVNDGTLAEVLNEEKIPYVISPTKPWVVASSAKYRILRGLKAAIQTNKYAEELAVSLKGKGYDLVYSNNSTIQLGAVLARKLGLSHVWHVREYGQRDYDIIFSYPKFIVKKYFERAKKVIAISKDLKAYFTQNVASSANIKLIYNGIPATKQKRESFSRPDNVCNFVCVGALQEGKNQLELLKAGRLLLLNDIKAFHIHFFGEGNEYEELLRDYCKDNDLEKYVTFHGYTNKADEILDKMHVGVMCSKAEAFGRVTIEYMLSSLPVIGAAGAGTSEIVVHNQTGFLYPLGNEQELMDDMKCLIEDEALCMKMGMNGYDRAVGNFTAKKNTDLVYALLDDALKLLI